MSLRGWLGLPLFGTHDESGPTGLVLSGGGARASFQIGALQYLYRETDMHPSVFVGTSAGAILTSALAQWSSREDQARCVDTLEALWRGLEKQADLYISRPWFEKLREHGADLIEMLATQKHPAHTRRPITPTMLPLPKILRREESPQEPDTRSPLEKALAPDAVPSADWSPSLLAQVLNNLGALGRAGGDLPMIVKGAEKTKSAYRPGPLLAKLLDPDVFDVRRVQTSGMVLRIAMVGLRSGELRFMREDGVLVDRECVPVSDLAHDLAVGVLASCAIPAVFAPVELGEEIYVDGGVRENLPAEMSIGHLGTRPTYAITSNPVSVPFDGSAGCSDIVSLMMRSTEILSDEALRDEVAYARSAGAIVIEPELDVHDALTVHPTLIAINIDYGWTRAAEQCRRATSDEIAKHRDAFAARLHLHDVRERLLLTSAKEDAIAEVHATYRLKDALKACDPTYLAPGWEHWGR